MTRLAWLGLFVVLALASWGRLANWEGAFRTDRPSIIGTDGYYQMRRIQLAVADYPNVPLYDAWGNAPEGMWVDWPIGFPLAVASGARIAVALSGDPESVRIVALLANPVLGVLAVVLVFALARRVAGNAAGLFAGLVAAGTPLLCAYSMVGRIDHHAAESLLVAGSLWALVRSAEARSAPRQAAWASGCGVWLALAIGVWPGALVAGAFVFGSLAVALAACDDEREAARLERIGAIGFATAAVLSLPIIALHPWAAAGGFVYYAPSWLQPSCFLLAAAVFALAGRVQRAVGERRPRALGLGLAVLGLVGAALALQAELRDALAQALGFVTRSRAEFVQADELRPLFELPLDIVVRRYTWLALLAPVALGAPLLLLRTRRGVEWISLLLVSVALWMAVPLAVFQPIRLGTVFTPLWAVAWGIALGAALDRLRARWPRRGLAEGCVLLLLAPVVVATAPRHAPRDYQGAAALQRSLDALHWLRDRAADPGDVWQPDHPPAFSVMSRWMWGHWINSAGHANVANPFGQTATATRGLERAAAFYLSEHPGEATRLLEKLRVRYVLVTPLVDGLWSMALHGGRHFDDYFDSGAQPGALVTRPRYHEIANSRLRYLDGSPASDGAPGSGFRRMRLVFESAFSEPVFGADVPYCKVFERVAGAHLLGIATPGAHVALSLELSTNRGRRFTYRDAARADADGRFHFVVPYATGLGVPRVAVFAERAYSVVADGWRWEPQVSDRQVHEGSEIELGAPIHAP